MQIVPLILLPLLHLFLSSAAMPSALAPGADEHTSHVYIVFVSRADYVDSVDYDVRMLASIVGSIEEAKTAIIYHFGGLGFAARLSTDEADQLSKKEGISILKDQIVEKDVRLSESPGFVEDNI